MCVCTLHMDLRAQANVCRKICTQSMEKSEVDADKWLQWPTLTGTSAMCTNINLIL